MTRYFHFPLTNNKELSFDLPEFLNDRDWKLIHTYIAIVEEIYAYDKSKRMVKAAADARAANAVLEDKLPPEEPRPQTEPPSTTTKPPKYYLTLEHKKWLRKRMQELGHAPDENEIRHLAEEWGRTESAIDIFVDSTVLELQDNDEDGSK